MDLRERIRNLHNYVIYEASKTDYKKLKEKGEENLILRKGADIVNSAIIKHDTKPLIGGYTKRNIDNLNDFEKKILRSNPSKIGKSEPDKSNDKHKIKSSTRGETGVIPEYGANPKYSKDISKKSKDKYKESFKYSKYDIKKSLKNLPEGTKKSIIEDRLRRGKSLPKSMDIDLIPIKSKDSVKNEKHSNSYWEKHFDDSNIDLYDRLYELYKIMNDTNDYYKYKKAYNEFTSLTNISKKSVISAVRFIDDRLVFHYNINREKEPETSKSTDKFYHGSKSDNIKKLTPTFKSNDGSFYPTPRIYFSKNSYGSKYSGSTSSDSNPQYIAKTSPKTSYEDMELGGSARYVKTKKEIPVKRVK